MMLLYRECGCHSRDQSQPKMPVLFSLSHPLDETAPVICRSGGTSFFAANFILSVVCHILVSFFANVYVTASLLKIFQCHCSAFECRTDKK